MSKPLIDGRRAFELTGPAHAAMRAQPTGPRVRGYGPAAPDCLLKEMKMSIYYIDGRFVPADEAMIPVDDLALLRGFGVFDLMRTHGGRPYFLEAHLKRLEQSARRIGLPLPWSRRQLADIIGKTLSRNYFAEANIRTIITGGSSPDFVTPQGRPRLLVLVSPAPELPQKWYKDGVKIIVYHGERLIPDAKSLNYVPGTMAMDLARRQGAVEAVYVDRQNRVRECSSSNIFAFQGDDLITPAEGILEGITRQVVIDLAQKRFRVHLREVLLTELLKADEVFITGSNKGIVPVVAIDQATIADGRPGARTRKLMDRLHAHQLQYFGND